MVITNGTFDTNVITGWATSGNGTTTWEIGIVIT